MLIYDRERILTGFEEEGANLFDPHVRERDFRGAAHPLFDRRSEARISFCQAEKGPQVRHGNDAHKAASIVHDRDRAEDIMQETFLRALAKIDTYRAEAPPRSWFSSIAINLCRHHLLALLLPGESGSYFRTAHAEARLGE